jgi:hypothetical protein
VRNSDNNDDDDDDNNNEVQFYICIKRLSPHTEGVPKLEADLLLKNVKASTALYNSDKIAALKYNKALISTMLPVRNKDYSLSLQVLSQHNKMTDMATYSSVYPKSLLNFHLISFSRPTLTEHKNVTYNLLTFPRGKNLIQGCTSCFHHADALINKAVDCSPHNMKCEHENGIVLELIPL